MRCAAGTLGFLLIYSGCGSGEPSGEVLGPQPFQTGEASAMIELSEQGCLASPVEIETALAVTLRLPAGACLSARDGNPLTGPWSIHIDGLGAPDSIDSTDLSTERIGVVRIFARSGSGAEPVAFVSSSSVTLELELGEPGPGSDGVAHLMHYAGDTLAELDARATPRPLVYSTTLLRKGPERVLISGSRVLGFARFLDRRQALSTTSHGSEHFATTSITADPELYPHVCNMGLLAAHADVVFASIDILRRVDGRVSEPNPHGNWTRQLSGGESRELSVGSDFSNVFAVEYFMCDDEDGGEEPGLDLRMTGGSEGETDLAARYVGITYVDVTNRPAISVDESIEYFRGIEVAGADARHVALINFGATDSESRFRVALYDYRASVRVLAGALAGQPGTWTITPSDRHLRVDIRAEEPRFVVGGVVTGLSGTVTLDNAGEALVVTSTGAFAFPTAIADGERYDVTVTSQPAGQTCTVQSGSGRIDAADVTDVEVDCVETSAGVSVTYWLQRVWGSASISTPGFEPVLDGYDTTATIEDATPAEIADSMMVERNEPTPFIAASASGDSKSTLTISPGALPTIRLGAELTGAAAMQATVGQNLTYSASAEPRSEAWVRFTVEADRVAYQLTGTVATSTGSNAQVFLVRGANEFIVRRTDGEGTGGAINAPPGLLEAGDYQVITRVIGLAGANAVMPNSGSTAAHTSVVLTLSPAP